MTDEYRDEDGFAAISVAASITCPDCNRPMLAQRAYDRDPAVWRERGYVSTGSHGLCKNCAIKKYAVRSKRCTVDGCHNPHAARGYCTTHYDRWRRGKPITPATPASADPHTVIYLRQLVGIPPDGPTVEQKRRWARQEASP